MATIFKFSGYAVSPDEEIDSADLKEFLGTYTDAIIKHIKIEEREIGEWDDKNPLNFVRSPVEECEKYFTE